ncbi:MAG TPA: sugar phosphate isomerase/epimerase family protein [Planctomycetota bacterium]|nr:sugar phosphate isomerase/epimerase family protein [Planctomycetota bacterium]
MAISRRTFLEQSSFAAAAAAVLGVAPCALWSAALRRANIRVAATDWNLAQEGKIGAFALAKEAQLDGVQVSLGKNDEKKGEDKLPMMDPERQKTWLEESRKTGIPIVGTCLEILHRDNLKAHANGPKWVEQSIAATAALGTKVILLPFFGKQQIKEREEQKATADRLKVLAPLAEKAGVVLGLEDTISAEDNAWILDQVASPAVKVYYDVGNSFGQKYDIYKEIVWLGKDRVCQLHIKDNPNYLGKGGIDMPKYVEAVLKSGFEGWAVLETSSPSKDIKADMITNSTYLRGLLSR